MRFKVRRKLLFIQYRMTGAFLQGHKGKTIGDLSGDRVYKLGLGRLHWELKKIDDDVSTVCFSVYHFPRLIEDTRYKIRRCTEIEHSGNTDKCRHCVESTAFDYWPIFEANVNSDISKHYKHKDTPAQTRLAHFPVSISVTASVYQYITVADPERGTTGLRPS